LKISQKDNNIKVNILMSHPKEKGDRFPLK